MNVVRDAVRDALQRLDYHMREMCISRSYFQEAFELLKIDGIKSLFFN